MELVVFKISGYYIKKSGLQRCKEIALGLGPLVSNKESALYSIIGLFLPSVKP